MYFTNDDYLKIEKWLMQRTARDTSFPTVDPLEGTEDIPVIQDGKNKLLGLKELTEYIIDRQLIDFYNVTERTGKTCLTLKEAIRLVPIEQRKFGLVITFYDESGNWLIYQFKGKSLKQWDSADCWETLFQEALDAFVPYPDEEDITGVRKNDGKIYLKFRDKDYDPEDFSGLGRIILRKNIKGTEACAIDDEDHLLNVLTQDMIREKNTIYIIQYDFDLEGKVISIPEGSTLWFQGGSINNGSVYLHETPILGAFEFADMGNARLFGEFNTGQVMTFSDDSYKAKKGGYFTASSKQSSASPQEDNKQDRETFYAVNPNAYTTETRQELRWWNGTEWILLLDITDYREIKSIINDLIDKHNTEMSECYRYFKTRCYALEQRMNTAEDNIQKNAENISKNATNIQKNADAISDIRDNISEIETNIDNIETNIDQIETNIDNVEGNIDTIEGNINTINNNINRIDTNIDNIESSINGIERNIDVIEGDINSIGRDITTINNKITTIEGDIRTINSSISNVSSTLTTTVNKVDNIEQAVTNLSNTINNLDNIINEHIQQYIESTVLGVQAISLNGEVLSPDENGTITLPDYPEVSGPAESVKGILTVNTSEGTVLGTYNGSENKTITIPAASSSSSADKVAHKLKFTGAVTKEYDGSQEVTVNIPQDSSSDVSTINSTLSNFMVLSPVIPVIMGAEDESVTIEFVMTDINGNVVDISMDDITIEYNNNVIDITA